MGETLIVPACGMMAQRVGAMDWSLSPLGAMQDWSASLRVAVELCLSSRFPMHVWWGPGLTYVYNDAHAPILGTRHPDALGRSAADVWAEIWPMLTPQVEAVMLRGESTWNEQVHVAIQRDGGREDAWFTWSYSPIRDESGQIGGLMCIATEDTARVLAERERYEQEEQRMRLRAEELHKSQATLAAIVESSDDAIIGKTLDGTIITWNTGARRLFGYEAVEVVGKHISMLIPQDRQHEEATIQERLARGDRIEHFETLRVTRDARIIDVSLTVSPIKNSAGRIIGASKIVRDITARKRTEESLARHSEELTRSNLELERFAHVASHDLQEPMRTVQSFAQLLQKACGEDLKGNAAEYLGYVIGGVARMRQLVNDMLAYSRVDSLGNGFVEVDSNEICRRVLEDLRASIDASQAVVMVGQLPAIMCDPTQLGQLFQNLLSNAIKFHGERAPQIRVSSKNLEKDWIFSIEDNGIGIATEYFERIFIIFQRLHTMEEYGGTGIGLAVCKKIVERHGGRLWVESEVGKGSTFHFSIPKRER